MNDHDRERAVLVRRVIPLALAALVLLALALGGATPPSGPGGGAVPAGAEREAVSAVQEAQEAEGTWWSWALERILAGEREASPSELRVILDRDPGDAPSGPPGRGRGRAQRGEQPGPAFCRSGEGHPVFGRRWCLEKGFRLGDAVWRRIRVGDVVLGPPGDRETVEEPDLVEILGDVIIGRMLEASGLRDRDGLTGRWTRSGSGEARVLQLRAGDRPVAELTDLEGDGRVDAVLINDPDAGD